MSRRVRQRLSLVATALLLGATLFYVQWVERRQAEELSKQIVVRLAQAGDIVELRDLLGATQGIACAVHESDSVATALQQWPDMQRLVLSKPLGWVDEIAYASWALAWKADSGPGKVAFVPFDKVRLLRPLDYPRLGRAYPALARPNPSLCVSVSGGRLLRVEAGKGPVLFALIEEGTEQ